MSLVKDTFRTVLMQMKLGPARWDKNDKMPYQKMLAQQKNICLGMVNHPKRITRSFSWYTLKKSGWFICRL